MLPPNGFTRVSLFDPELARSLLGRDPIAQAIRGQWRNTQFHGRIAYDQMARHPAAGNPFKALLAIVTSIRVNFVAPQEEPTQTQREMAEFLNAQLARLDWPKFVEGVFGQAYQYGFSLAELSTTVENWKKRPFVQIKEVTPIPQATLDTAWMYGLTSYGFAANDLSTSRPTYTCFDFDDRGKITGYHQYRTAQMDNDKAVSWTSPQERLRILHFKRGGGDGNPFGESLFFMGFDSWADLYLDEKLEQVLLENAMPYLTASYEGDETKPDLHQAVMELVSESEPSRRLLVGNKIKFGKVTVTDPDYVKHVEIKKEELRSYITQSLLVPNSVYRESNLKDLDTRNLVQVFLKFVIPAYMDEIASFMTKQFGKRLIDSNYSNVESGDIPVFRWRFVTANDLRLVQSVLQLAMPHLDSEKLGEVFSEYLPGFQPEYIARDPKGSVGVVRQSAIDEAKAATEATANGTPPPKEAGEDRERIDGDTDSIGQSVDVAS